MAYSPSNWVSPPPSPELAPPALDFKGTRCYLGAADRPFRLGDTAGTGGGAQGYDMGNGFQFIDIIFFALVAVFIIVIIAITSRGRSAD